MVLWKVRTKKHTVFRQSLYLSFQCDFSNAKIDISYHISAFFKNNSVGNQFKQNFFYSLSCYHNKAIVPIIFESCQLKQTTLCACRFADAPKQVIIR